MSYNPNTFGQTSAAIEIIAPASPQDLTGSWVNIGSEISMLNYTHLTGFISIVINNSTGVRVRLLGKHTIGDSNTFPIAIESASSSNITIEPEYIEFSNNANQSMILKFNTTGVAAVQLQCMANVVGAVAGQISSLTVTKVLK